MLRRILSLLMAICITMTLFPVAVLRADAAETAREITVAADEAPGTEPVIHHANDIRLTNPLYGDDHSITIDPDEGETIFQPVDETTYLSEAQAAREICDNFEARNTSFTVYVKSDKDYMTCFHTIWKMRAIHTGVPTEGDSMNWCWQSCSAPTSYYTKNGYNYLTYKFKVTYTTTAEQEATLANREDQLLEQLDLWENTDYQKVKGVYDYMCANISYDYDNLHDSTYKLKFTAYAALVNKTAVCAGYSVLFYQLMLKLGVDTRCISGTITSTGKVSDHAWNIVKLDSKYYYVDSTWDASLGPNNYKWFLTSPSSFCRRHYPDTSFDSSFWANYPVASDAYPVTTSSYLQITSQPAPQALKAGSTAKLSVTVKGENPSYRWYVTDNFGTYVLTSTSSTCSFTMTESYGDRRAYCVISDTAGRTVHTNTVTIKMAPPLKITKQPASSTVPIGAKVHTSVSATGVGLKYQWYYKNPGSSSYKKSSLTSATYHFKMTEAKSGRKVYCIITDKYGAQVKTKTVTLSMATPVKITKQPSSVKVPIGDTAKVSVSATGDGLTYQWYVKNAGSSKYSKSSITGPTYKVKMTAKVSGRKVYCVITDKYGEKVKTKTVSLNKKASPVITKQPASVKVSVGSTAKATVTATGEGLKYQWYVKNPGSSKYSKSSITGPTYKVKMTAKISGRKVYCVISDKYGNKVKSEVAALRVK